MCIRDSSPRSFQHPERDRWGSRSGCWNERGGHGAWSNASTGPVAAGRLTAAGSAAPKLTAKLLAINPGWLLYPMGSVTTGRVRHAEQLGVELPVPIRVTEYRLRHGHSQTDTWHACYSLDRCGTSSCLLYTSPSPRD